MERVAAVVGEESDVFAGFSEGVCGAVEILNALRDVRGEGIAKRVAVEMGDDVDME